MVVLPQVVPPELCEELLEGCREEEQGILQVDEKREGNRGEGRYSLGEVQKTGHLLHRPEWARLVELEEARRGAVESSNGRFLLKIS